MKQQIKFYHINEPYGVFSNFDRTHPIKMAGKMWPSTEHFFQAMKFQSTDETHMENIRLAPTPRLAAAMGRDRTHPLRTDWESIKYDIMKQAIIAKFTQYPELRTFLIETGDAELIEHTTNDNVWGDGGDGSGQNLLGKILMEVRENIRCQTC